MRPKLTTTFPRSCRRADRGVCHDIVRSTPKLSRLWSMDSTGCSRPHRGALYENGSCSRSDERTDVTPIIEARSDTEPAESPSETVQAAVAIALVMARNSERATVIW